MQEIQQHTDDEVLTSDEVAAWLKQTEPWVRAHASGRRRPKLPGMKQGKGWRFRRSAVREWMLKLEREAQG